MDRPAEEFSDEDVERIAGTYHTWRGVPGAWCREDVKRLSSPPTLEEIAEHGYVSTRAARGAAVEEDDEHAIPERLGCLAGGAEGQFEEARRS
jgi:type I restriction enzyme M protein